MPIVRVTSRCECQARLTAEIETGSAPLTRGGWATRGAGTPLKAPAHVIRPTEGGFDLGWLCPYCGRNTMRTFDRGVLGRASSASP
jgi:hypothetical protein